MTLLYVAVPISTAKACDLVPLLLQLLQRVRDLLHAKGFTLNFALGKTNAVVSFRGSGASALRQEYQLGGAIPVSSEPSRMVKLLGYTSCLHTST